MGKIKISSWLWIWSLWRLTLCDHPASPRYNTLERCCGSKETTAVQTEHLMSYCHHERHKHSFTALSCQLLWVHGWWISQIFLSVSSSTQSVFPRLLRNNSISVISRQPVKIRKLPSSKQSGSNSLRPTLLSFSATVRPVLLVWLVQPRSKVPLRLSRSNASSHWLTDVPPLHAPFRYQEAGVLTGLSVGSNARRLRQRGPQQWWQRWRFQQWLHLRDRPAFPPL